MPALPSELRRQLENVCVAARDTAEAAARSALQKRAVDVAEPFAHFTAADRDLRTRLRARGRQAGDVRDNPTKTQGIDQLTQELAYEYWHRMLFARFLAENHLLMHPDGVAVSLAECDELAKSEGAPNGFVLAARYASRMLPQVFRSDDVLLEIEFAPEQRLALEKLLAGLPRETFLADDSLGWVYQFWQTRRKEEVNKSGDKIDGRTLPAVTQLFTEDYMVQFLLHNTIGAWWAGRRMKDEGGGMKAEWLACQSEADCRRLVALPGVGWEYLRFVRDGAAADLSNPKSEIPNLKSPWRPAAGTFEGWPQTLREFTMLDPCCGSGHFLVNAFNLLVPLRMHDDGLSASQACEAVLRENLFGLELDPRCTQIAAFALALAAWRYPGPDGVPLGYRRLPPLNIAACGLAPNASLDEWLRVAERAAAAGGLPVQRDLFGAEQNLLSSRVRAGLEELYRLFEQGPTLGSLLDPATVGGDLLAANFGQLQPLLAAALECETPDAEAHELGVAAHGFAKAAQLLAGKYTLVATNVPYLKGERHGPALHTFLAKNYPVSKGDLATAFIERGIRFSASGGSVAIVTLQAWLFLTRRAPLRRALLTTVSWEVLARLGPRAFTTISGEVVNVVLLILTNSVARDDQQLCETDVSGANGACEKAQMLQSGGLMPARQSVYLTSPDCRVSVSSSSAELLGQYCISLHGQSTFDSGCFEFYFFELAEVGVDWVPQQLTSRVTQYFDGCSGALRWEDGSGLLARLMEAKKAGGYTSGAWRAGVSVWGTRGVLVSQMDTLACTLYLGHSFDSNTAAIIPRDSNHLPAVWAYCSSPQFADEVRLLDRSLKVTNATLAKVPFDLAHWQKVAQEKYPDGLPKPFSSDPTQWLFDGNPAGSDDPLQVAVARLLGYRWPRQTGSSFPDCPALGPDGLEPLADRDGLVPIPSVRGEPPAAERLLELLRVSCQLSVVSCQNADHGPRTTDHGQLTMDHVPKLLSAAGCKPGTSVDDWLRNGFFEQHCKRFHNRPFVWHIWDGRKDGFACLVNYHLLDHGRLESLTYAYLGDWLRAQADDARAGKPGADLRLAAAQALQEKLKLILAGEPPYDIFVRWKPLSEQAIGWHPDLNDGVRMNIRPFVLAGVLRKNPNIKWTKDRGREPERDRDEYPWFWNGKEFVGDRVNDVHLTTADKQAARDRVGHG